VFICITLFELKTTARHIFVKSFVAFYHSNPLFSFYDNYFYLERNIICLFVCVKKILLIFVLKITVVPVRAKAWFEPILVNPVCKRRTGYGR
jgi:hypothetical protein